MVTKFEELFDHGIYQDSSDIRAHVGVIARKVFVFKTSVAVKAVAAHPDMPLLGARQPGYNGLTASGYAVPLEYIEDLRVLSPESWSGWEGWTETLSTSEKGSRASALVCWMLKVGRFPLWIEDAHDDDRKNVQIQGTDIIVFARKKIQVKCDFRAGPTSIPGCSGRLFIQVQEINPLRRH